MVGGRGTGDSRPARPDRTLSRGLRSLGTGGASGAPTAGEPRVEYVGLLGWTGGLVTEMLSQIEVAGQKAVRPSYRAQPAAGQ
jgi:hypothetical protein